MFGWWKNEECTTPSLQLWSISDQQWGVLKAVSNVNDILAPKLVGLDVTD